MDTDNAENTEDLPSLSPVECDKEDSSLIQNASGM